MQEIAKKFNTTMKVFFLFISLVTFSNVTAQKPILTDTAYKTWIEVDGGSLSNDGKYVFYTTKNEPLGGKTFLVTSTDKTWAKPFQNVGNPRFSDDSRYLFLMNGFDSLITVDLHSKRIKLIEKCSKYDLCRNGDIEWLIYHQPDKSGLLTIQNLCTHKVVKLENVADYQINDGGAAVVYKNKKKDSEVEEIYWLDLRSGKNKNIFIGKHSDNFIFDNFGNSLAFTLTDNGFTKIYLYRKAKDTAQLVTDDRFLLSKNLKVCIDDIWCFNKNADGLFFTLKENRTEQTQDVRKMPEIWSYRDQILKSQYIINGNKTNIGTGQNLSFLNFETKQIRQLFKNTQRLANNISYQNDEILVMQTADIANQELPSYDHAHLSYYLYFVKTGSIRSIKINCKQPLSKMLLSSDGKYLVYYDPEVEGIISYNIDTSESKNITQGINSLGKIQTYTRSTTASQGIVLWLTKYHKVIIQGTYDLWEVDLRNETPPRKLTSVHEDNTRYIYSLCSQPFPNEEMNVKQDYYLKGFDLETKRTSICLLNYQKKQFEKLYECDCYSSELYMPIIKSRFQKSKYLNAFLLKFQKANESPNYMFTRDFKNFTALSNVYPEKKYNWLSTELLTYRDSSGNICQGVLYKPENFDPEKKYPVLFNIYQELSNYKNQYLSPDPSGNGINIPLLVSNGYLVFQPNIYREYEKFGPSALQSVLAGVNALSKYPWVNTERMCLSGHSWGGLETNYIITQTNIFCAAIVGAGPSSVIDDYNDIWADLGFDLHGYVGGAMGGRLEDIPDIYVKTTPILFSKNIKTPLLLLHNKADANVPFYHSSHLFIQLRSMQKQVWLLSYPNELHTLSNPEFQLDYQTKVMGYLDYFLRAAPIPEWMLLHISLN